MRVVLQCRTGHDRLANVEDPEAPDSAQSWRGSLSCLLFGLILGSCWQRGLLDPARNWYRSDHWPTILGDDGIAHIIPHRSPPLGVCMFGVHCDTPRASSGAEG